MRARGLDYRMVWRWHFYAGLFAIPFVVWLSVTGAVYLFAPQIDAWLDRPYDGLVFSGALAAPSQQAAAAVAAVPGGVLHSYQLPRNGHAAAQVLVGRGGVEYRVYVNPQGARVLRVVQEERRPTRVLFHLHGELLLGDRGSNVVELAASWSIVLLLTGIYLWWPEHVDSFAGVLYVRLRAGQRVLWRDLHAVTGVWVCAWALFLLVSGLPWAAGWGSYLKHVRGLVAGHAVQQEWLTGSGSERAARVRMDGVAASMAGMDMPAVPGAVGSLAPLDAVVQTVAPMRLPFPVLVSPPVRAGGAWSARSDVADRPERVALKVDGATGAVLSRVGFAQKGSVDEVVAVGVAAHEGQLFGWVNQLVGLGTATGLVLLCVSAVVLWWRRRGVGVLGAPAAVRGWRWSAGLVAAVAMLGVYLPAMGTSLLAVLLLEWGVLRRVPAVAQWLGLRA